MVVFSHTMPPEAAVWRECWNSLLKAQLEDSSEAILGEGSLCQDSPLGEPLNTTLYLWHHRVWQIMWPGCRTAGTTTWTWCRPGPHSRLAAFCVTQYVGQSLTFRCAMCCLWNPKRPKRHCASFFAVGDTRWNTPSNINMAGHESSQGFSLTL